MKNLDTFFLLPFVEIHSEENLKMNLIEGKKANLYDLLSHKVMHILLNYWRITWNFAFVLFASISVMVTYDGLCQGTNIDKSVVNFLKG